MEPFKTFLFLCRCISFSDDDVKETSRLRKEIVTGNADWKKIIQIADRHFVLPFLYQSLKEKNLLECLPPDVRSFLKTVFELNLSRNRMHIKQILGIARFLNAIDVEPLLLKGGATLFSGLYPSEGVRMMNDLDLLVPFLKVEACIRVLTDAGYRPMEGVNLPETHYHCLPLVHADYRTRIELHKDLFQAPYRFILGTKEMWEKSDSLNQWGVRLRLPHPHHFVLHNIIHHQLSSKGYIKKEVWLYQMLDWVVLRKTLDSKIDWCDIKNRFERAGFRRSFLVYVVIGCRLFKQSVPATICSPVQSALIWHIFNVLCRYPRVSDVERAISPYVKDIRSAWKNPAERKALAKKFFIAKTYRDNLRSFIRQIRLSKRAGSRPYI